MTTPPGPTGSDDSSSSTPSVGDLLGGQGLTPSSPLPSGDTPLDNLLGGLGQTPTAGDPGGAGNPGGQAPPQIETPTIADTTSQVDLDNNGFLPDFMPDWASQMTAIGAVTVGSHYAARNLPAISAAAKAKALNLADDPLRLGINTVDPLRANPAVGTTFRQAWAGRRDPQVVSDLQRGARQLAQNPRSSSRAVADWTTRLGRGGASESAESGAVRNAARSIGRKLGSKMFASSTVRGKGAQIAGRMVGRMVEKAAAKQLAGVGMRLGLRLAAFAIPGPGWVLGAVTFATFWMDSDIRKLIKNGIGHLFGMTTPSIDAPPSPPDTHFLPLCHDDSRDSIIRAHDWQMGQVNDALFAFNPDSVWPPEKPAIETTPPFTATLDEATKVMQDAADLADRITSALNAAGDQQLVARAAQAMSPSLDSLGDLGQAVVVPIGNAVADLAQKTNETYQKVREANLKSRQEINNSSSGLLPWDYSVDDSKMGNLATAVEDYSSAAKNAYATVTKAIENWNTPKPFTGGTIDPPRQQAPTSTSPTSPQSQRPSTQNETPSSAAPTATAPSSPLAIPTTSSPTSTTPGTPVSSSPNTKASDVSDILRSATPVTPQTQAPVSQNPLGAMQQQNPLGQNPFGQTSPLGQGMFGQQNPLGQGLFGQQNPLGGNTAATSALRKLLQDKLGNTDDTEDTKNKKKDKDSDSEDADTTPATPVANKGHDGGAPTTASPVSAHPTGASGTTTGDTANAPGRPSAGTPAATTAGGHPTQGDDRAVTIDGKKVEFSDPRTAKMVSELNPTDGSAPPTVERAAGDAGFTVPAPGHDMGKVISAADMRPGDVVVGADHSGVFLGDGKVLVDGDVRPLGDIAKFTGPHQGIFRLDADPSAAAPGAPDASAAPVAGDSGSAPPVGGHPGSGTVTDTSAGAPGAGGAPTPSGTGAAGPTGTGTDVGSILGGSNPAGGGGTAGGGSTPGGGANPSGPTNPRVPTGD